MWGSAHPSHLHLGHQHLLDHAGIALLCCITYVYSVRVVIQVASVITHPAERHSQKAVNVIVVSINECVLAQISRMQKQLQLMGTLSEATTDESQAQMGSNPGAPVG